MTIKQMKNIAMECMEKQLSDLSDGMITFQEAVGFLSAFKSVGLFTDVEYFNYFRRLYHISMQLL